VKEYRNIVSGGRTCPNGQIMAVYRQ